MPRRLSPHAGPALTSLSDLLNRLGHQLPEQARDGTPKAPKKRVGAFFASAPIMRRLSQVPVLALISRCVLATFAVANCGGRATSSDIGGRAGFGATTPGGLGGQGESAGASGAQSQLPRRRRMRPAARQGPARAVDLVAERLSRLRISMTAVRLQPVQQRHRATISVLMQAW